MKRAALTSACALLVAAASCTGARPAPNTPPSAEAARGAKEDGKASPRAPALGPPRWVVTGAAAWIERTEAGIDRSLTGGRRVEARGADVIARAKDTVDFEGAAAAPPWSAAPAAPARYVLWREREVFGAATWLGEARPLGKLPATVQNTFDWIDGVGLVTAAGVFVVSPAGGPPRKLDLPGFATGLAADARRALVLTVFGHARLTTDGGATYRDVSAELPEATELEVRGDDLHVLLRGEESRLVDARGALVSDRAPQGPRRHEPPPELDDFWPEDAAQSPLEAAAAYGMRWFEGDALTVTEDAVARVDLRTGRATALLALETPEDTCAPLRVKDGALLVCESRNRAAVLDLASGGRIERTFDLPDAPAWDRFVVADGEALGFVGPCEGPAPGSPADVVASASPTNASNQRSPVFCVRKGPGAWVEHRLAPADASDVVAWIPRAEGAAVALVALPVTFVHNTPRVTVRGALRVVRVGRNEPPLDITTYSSETNTLLTRALHVTPDGTLEGWLPSAHGPSNLAAVTIDAEGRPRQHALPAQTVSLTTSGRFGLARTETERLFETTDYGRSFRLVEPPPSGGSAEPMSCSEIGCQVGTFVRIGWNDGSTPAPEDTAPPKPNPEYQRPIPEPPLVRLACRYAGPGEGKRIPDSFGLGHTQTPIARLTPGRIGFTGGMFIPWSGPQPGGATGDAEVAYVPLLDLAAPIVRATIPLSRLGPTPFHPYEIRLGYVLDGTKVRAVATAGMGRCAASLVDDAGLTLPIGGCIEDPAVGVVHGSRALLVSGTGDRQAVSTVELPRSAPTPGRAVLPGARRELGLLHPPDAASRFDLAAGLRGKDPVVVAVDAGGDAVLAPLDPDRGTLGPEKRLVSLEGLTAASDPRCAPQPDDARVVLPFDTEIGLAQGMLHGIVASGSAGFAVLRWSPARVCLEAVEIAVRDERHEVELGAYDPPGTVRKLIARFDGKGPGKGTLVVLGFGTEVRQPLTCEGIVR
ncbi:hypothetical protein [Polyangium fumosum]|uniref:Uncharacterized protein n=1 Tax=Polyangium fumosum TaxID=889272 RepID=A0A4U1J8D5_9BACT|nr:hypothetical protein [Polyangium fumosum]TKD03822.1 hypothetical protein E8A74_24880 [Polyangium fumosum]